VGKFHTIALIKHSNIVHRGCHDYSGLEEVLASLRPDPRGGRRREYGSQRGNSPSTQSYSTQDDESKVRESDLLDKPLMT